MKTFYRVSRETYSKGDLINSKDGYPDENGVHNMQVYSELILQKKWIDIGNILRQNPKSADAYTEAYLEIIRKKDFPSLPCRYKSLIVCDNLKDAKEFQRVYRTKNNQISYIYELEVPSDKYFVGDMNMLNDRSTEVEDMLKKYWKGEKTSTPFYEFLLFPREFIKIKKLCEDSVIINEVNETLKK